MNTSMNMNIITAVITDTTTTITMITMALRQLTSSMLL
jgi:hypothetical protein